jgi:tetratricopeptide (TPR) repeat protein
LKPGFRPPAQAARVAASPAAKQAQAKFNQALALHQSGQLAPARALYQEVLKLQPAHFDALHCMGVLAYQTRDPAASVAWIDKALALNPRYAPAHNNRGAALKDLGQWDAALASYDSAIALDVHYAEAWNNRAVVLRELGQHQAAVDSYRVAIKHKPDYADAWNNLGNVLAHLMEHEAALDNYEQAVRFKPDHADAWYNRGNTLAQLGRHAAAVESHDRAISLKPGHAGAFHNRGTALAAMGEHRAAVGSYERALALKPAYAQAWYNRGVALGLLQEHQQAIECYDRVIALGGEFLAEAHNNRGAALAALQRHEAAIESYAQALACRPDYVDAYYNRGNALGFLQQHQLAIDSFEQAIALQPEHASALSNRAHALTQLMQHGPALESYEKAIAADPGHGGAHLGLAMSLLQLGDFGRGWKHYEWRWEDEALKKVARNFSQPLWTGTEPLQGKTILLHAEQGFGDTLQFCRYAKMVGALGARVLVEVQPALLGLLEGLDGADQVLAKGQPLPDFDCHCPLLSLPLALGTTLDTLPSGKPYLSAPAHKVVQWTQRLGHKTRPRVGLVWSGNAVHKNDRNRSVALAELMAHLPEAFDYISLQKEFRPDDRQTLEQHPHILRLDQEIGDFSDTAALCALMDVVITVDTSVAHLAGALGRPVWLALTLNPDWRWLLERSDSPWYDTVTLYRQQAAGQWGPVLDRMAADLNRLAAV